MPESRKRRSAVYTPPVTPSRTKKKPPSPPWFGATIVGLFAVGIAYLLCYYLSSGAIPIRSLNGWNIFVGFAFIVTGFGLMTQWR